MGKKAANSHKPWTPGQETQLKSLVRGNVPTRVMRIKLGRSPDAIYSKASDMKVSVKPTNQRPYGTRKGK